MLAKLNRNQRLQRASDPATPVEELLRLALEFPDTVAANPTLILAVASDPGVLRAADPVALACIITSPDAPAPLAQAIETIALRTLDEKPISNLRNYLAQWRACGCPQRSVDLTRLAPAASIPVAIEQGIRGRAILLQRLGRDRVLHAVDFLSREGYCGEFGVFMPPPKDIEADSDDWSKADSLDILQLLCRPTLGGITDDYTQQLSIEPTSSGALGADLCVAEQLWDGFILAEFTGGIEPPRCDVEREADSNCDGTDDVPMPADTALLSSLILDPWRSTAKSLPKGQFLIIDGEEVKCGTPNEVRLALRESRRAGGCEDLDEDDDAEDGEDGEECQSMTDALKQCVARYNFCPAIGNAPFLSEGSLKDAPFGANALGGPETIQKRLKSLAELLPIAGPKHSGMNGDYDYSFVIMDGDKYAALFVGDVRWLKSLHRVTVELDPMN